MSNIMRNVKLLSLFNFFHDFLLYSPIAIIYFAQVTGSFVSGMTIFSIIFITQSILELPLGIVSDFIGRKKTLVTGSFCFFFAVLCYAIGLNFWTLAIGAVLEGLSRTLFSGNNAALLYESLKQEGKVSQFAEFSGKTNSMVQLALSISALVGGAIAILYSLKILFWLNLIPAFIAVILTLFAVEPKIHSTKFENNVFAHLKEAWFLFRTNKRLRLLVYSDSISLGVGRTIHNFRPAFIGFVWPVWAVGLYRGLTNACGFIGFQFAGKIITKFKLLNSLLFSNLFGSMIQCVALLLSNIFSPILMAIPSLLFGVDRTAISTLQQKEFSDKQRATMGSLSGMLSSIVFAVFAVAVGWIADFYGVIIALFIGEALLLSVLYLNYKLYKMG